MVKRCLITGATGFVGSKLCLLLNQADVKINILSRHQVIGVWENAYVCDLANDIIPEGAFQGVETVYHLAGVAHDVRRGAEVEAIYKRVNVDATIKLAELAAKNNVTNFVYVSSVKAGGSSFDNVCIDENYQGDPEGIYGSTKREAEIKLLELGIATGMHVSIIRPALVYGEGVKGNLRAMLTGVSKKWFPPLPETNNCRSMVHVEDLVKAIQLVAEKKDANGEIFIVTDGRSYSSCEIYNEMCLAVGRVVPGWYVPKFLFTMLAKVGDILNSFINFPFDTYRLNKLLGSDCYNSDKIRKRLSYQSEMTLKDALPDMIEKRRP